MARGGFFQRLARVVRNIVAPPSPPPPPPPPPRPRPEPPQQPEPREREQRGITQKDYRDAWRENKSKAAKGASFERNYKFFNATMEHLDQAITREERLELWESYVTNIVNPRGRHRRQDTANMFWRDSGIDPQSEGFNWPAWRVAMGYTGSRRSKTP